ncbi:MAG TPA: type II toxin-antitoxin system HipA family toxin, partial [Gammaproteobacteria bacterium]|nr:type II toxin-antitoxin system HipA family toxin [Gammaproteobacteria bacterium]
RNLAMEVGRFGRAGSIHNLVSEAPRFRFSPEAARSEINRIADVIRKDWRQVFHDAGVSEKDVHHIEPAMVPESFFLEVPPEPVLIV